MTALFDVLVVHNQKCSAKNEVWDEVGNA